MGISWYVSYRHLVGWVLVEAMDMCETSILQKRVGRYTIMMDAIYWRPVFASSPILASIFLLVLMSKNDRFRVHTSVS